MRQFKSQHTGGAINKRRIGGQKIQPKYEVMGTCGKDSKKDDHLITGNGKLSCTHHNDRNGAAIRDLYHIGQGWRQNLLHATTKIRTHDRDVSACVDQSLNRSAINMYFKCVLV